MEKNCISEKKKVLAIGAHFDDIELGCGGALWKHMLNGDDIYMLVVTSSDYVSKKNNHNRSKQDALNEGMKSAKLLNARLITGNFKTLELTPNKDLINFLCDEVNNINPQIVYTHFVGDQHLDHKAVAQASLISTRNVKEVYSYVSNIYDTYPAFSPNYFVDISNVFTKKIDLIKCFESEVVTHPHWESQLKYYNGLYGIKEYKDYVEPYQVIRIIK